MSVYMSGEDHKDRSERQFHCVFGQRSGRKDVNGRVNLLLLYTKYH